MGYGNERKDLAFAACAGAHNEYIIELQSTNKLIDEYHSYALPWVLDVSLCLLLLLPFLSLHLKSS